MKRWGTWFYGLSLSGLLVLLIAGASGQQAPAAQPAPSGQSSLADVARKNKPTARAKKVVTDDDMPSKPAADSGSSSAAGASAGSGSSSAPSSAQPDSSKAAASTPDAAAKPAAGEKSNEKSKQDRLAELKKDHDTMEKMIPQIQAKIDADPSLQESMGQTIQHLRERIQENEEEARKLESKPASEADSKPPEPKQQ